MITIKHLTDIAQQPRSSADIDTGQAFYGSIGVYKGLFLKSYECIVFLEDPSKIWVGNFVPVNSYIPVDLEITVKKCPA